MEVLSHTQGSTPRVLYPTSAGQGRDTLLMLFHWDGKLICYVVRDGRIVAAYVVMDHTDQDQIEERR